VSQENKDKADAAETRTRQTKGFMQQVRVASRRNYTPEEKVRIVLEGFRREVAVNELCLEFRTSVGLKQIYMTVKSPLHTLVEEPDLHDRQISSSYSGGGTYSHIPPSVLVLGEYRLPC